MLGNYFRRTPLFQTMPVPSWGTGSSPAVLLPEPNTKRCKETQGGGGRAVFLALGSAHTS